MGGGHWSPANPTQLRMRPALAAGWPAPALGNPAQEWSWLRAVALGRWILPQKPPSHAYPLSPRGMCTLGAGAEGLLGTRTPTVTGPGGSARAGWTADSWPPNTNSVLSTLRPSAAHPLLASGSYGVLTVCRARTGDTGESRRKDPSMCGGSGRVPGTSFCPRPWREDSQLLHLLAMREVTPSPMSPSQH